ncbi:MAG: hypothetical protein QGH25_07240 [Candidatus Latescibacteria bacterium]|nr:hypothetical protein [Candidatus Latescibacterota bacterium]
MLVVIRVDWSDQNIAVDVEVHYALEYSERIPVARLVGIEAARYRRDCQRNL